jgi:DNA-binding transcriptional MerR regulator
MPKKSKNSAGASLMRISAAAQAAGVTRQTVEYYIMIGLVQPIRPPDRKGRFFDDELVKRIRLIRKLNGSGYTLRDIREVYFKGKFR